MKWYFAHVPRAEGVDPSGRQNNWLKYIFDFQSYDASGKAIPASASLLSNDVTTPESKTHTLRIAFRSADQIDRKSLDAGDLGVTGPDGKSLAVRLVAGNEPGNRSYRVVRYEVTAPAASWQASGDAAYEVTLRANEVLDLRGTPLPAARLGQFRYEDASPSGTLTIQAPDTPLLPGGRGLARATLRTASGDDKDVTRGALWSSDSPKVATIDPHGTIRAFRAGRTSITARSGKSTASARVEVRDPGLPAARLVRARGVTRPSAEPIAIVISYADPNGIVPESIGPGDVRVVGPNGFHQFPELAAIEESGARGGVIATYGLMPPAGRWGSADRGVYTIEVKGFQVADGKGNHVPEQVIGRFRVLESATRRSE
jgi:hypothetical protein